MARRGGRLLGGAQPGRAGLIGSELTVRPARPDDVETLIGLIRGLAEFERLTEIFKVTPEGLAEHLFGPRPYAEALLAEREGSAVGYVIFHHTYSTFRGMPGIYLEDIYVRDEARGTGAGARLMAAVAAIASERDCHRIAWSVLDWNRSAMDFYDRLGARPDTGEWLTYSLSGAALRRLADTIEG